MNNSIQWAKEIIDNLPYENKELDYNYLENMLILALTEAYEAGINKAQNDYLECE